MMGDTKIIYTPEAEKRLESAKKTFLEKLLKVIKSRKYYPGEDIIEVTASDIDIAMRYLEFREPSRTAVKLNLLMAYFIIGFVTFIFGLFYRDILSLFYNNPARLILVVCGLVMSVASLFMYTRTKREMHTKEERDRHKDEF